MIDTFTPNQVAALARELYVDGPVIPIMMQHYRPFICPFELLIKAVPAGSSVLDIGCGAGLFLGLLSKFGRATSGLGIDTSKHAIEMATRMISRLAPGHGIRFEVRSADAPLPADQYDVVSLVDVMHHIPPAHQQQVLEQAIARIAPGGRLLYKDMVAQPLWRAVANRLHDLVIARQWIHYLPIERAIAWSAAEGLVVRERRSVNMFWYGHEMIVLQRRPLASKGWEEAELSSASL